MLPGVDDGITVVSTDLDTSVSWAYFTEET